MIERGLSSRTVRYTHAVLKSAMRQVISEQLGHASTAFTLDTYAHVLPHMQDEAVAKVEAMLLAQGVGDRQNSPNFVI